MISSDDNDQDSGILFSRGASADAFGKLHVIIPEFRLDPDSALKLQKAANDSGVSVAEIVRAAVRVRLYGKEHVETVAREHISRIIGNVGEMSESTDGSSKDSQSTAH